MVREGHGQVVDGALEFIVVEVLEAEPGREDDGWPGQMAEARLGASWKRGTGECATIA